MKLKLLSTGIVIFYLSLSVFAQQGSIKGILYDGNTNKPVPKVEIKMSGAQVTETDDEGKFEAVFNSKNKPGLPSTITLVNKPNWVVFTPMFGVETIGDKIKNKEQLDITIVPRGSLRSFESERLNAIITKMRTFANAKLERPEPRNTLINNQSRRIIEDAERDKANEEFLEDYSNEYSRKDDKTFKERLKKALDEWSQILSARDKQEESNKKYWKKAYEDAIADMYEFVRDNSEQNRNEREGLNIKREKVYGYLSIASDFIIKYSPEKALDAVTELQQRFDSGEFSKEKLQEEWADTLLFLSGIKSDLGMGMLGDKGVKLLKEAVELSRQAEKFYTLERSQQDWTLMQSYLGRILGNLAIKTGGKEGLKLQQQSFEIQNSALKVTKTLSKDWILREVSPRQACYCDTTEYPQALSIAKRNLANTISIMGQMTGGDEGLKLSRQAVETYRSALKVDGFTPEKFPKDWAITQAYLGGSLKVLGEIIGGDEGLKLLKEAVETYRSALKVDGFTFEKFPHDWVDTQQYLGESLQSLSKRRSGDEELNLLRSAVKVYRDVLSIKDFTFRNFENRRLLAQKSLGLLYIDLSKKTSGDEEVKNLKEAIETYRSALKVDGFTFEKFPHDWVDIQISLGHSLQDLSEKTNGSEGLELLREAKNIFRSVLEEMSKFPNKWESSAVDIRRSLAEEFSLAHQNIHNYLAFSLTKLALRVQGDEGLKLLREAVETYRSALKVDGFTPEKFPKDWAITQAYLGDSLKVLGEIIGGDEGLKLLKEAVETYRSALKVDGFTFEKFPKDWVGMQISLAQTYSTLKDPSKAEDVFEQILRLDQYNIDVINEAFMFYHEYLFRFEKSFNLYQQWSARYPNDIPKQVYFTVNHFTTGRFNEFQSRIDNYYGRSKIEVPDYIKIVLRATEIANLLALGNENQIAYKLDFLIDEVSHQPHNFQIPWSFKGTNYYIAQNQKLSPYRIWLNNLFNALLIPNQRERLIALKEVKTNFKK